MPERVLLRIGAVSAIGGAILLVVFNLLHPRTDPGDLEASLRTIAASTTWVGVHVGLLLAGLVLIWGLVALYRSIRTEPAAAWARLGFVTAVVSGSVFAVLSGGIDTFILKEAAVAWVNAPADESTAALHVAALSRKLVFGLYSVFALLFGVAIALYGLAVGTSDVYPKWWGWAGLVLGLAHVPVGVAALSTGLSTFTADALFPVLGLLVSLWVLAMGILLWRRSAAA